MGRKIILILSYYYFSDHEGKRDYLCNICGKDFGKKQKLIQHRYVVHEAKKTHKCKECNKSFYTRGSLEKHHSNVHLGKKIFLIMIWSPQ